MFSLSSISTTKSQSKLIAVTILDNVTGAPLTGLVHTSVRVSLLKSEAAAFATKSITSTEFTEIGAGVYLLALSETDLDTLGYLTIRIIASVAYVGTAIRPSYTFVRVCEEGIEGGFNQDEEHWIPILLETGSVSGTLTAAGGLAYTAVTASYRKHSATTFTAYTLTSQNFREILDAAAATGIYQIYFSPETLFDEIGIFDVKATGAFNTFTYNYLIVEPIARPVYITVLAADEVSGRAEVTVHAVDKQTGLVLQTEETDAIGQALFHLQDGEYIFTLTKGLEIFNENNKAITVVDPDEELVPGTQAEVISGSIGPFVLVDGDTLQIKADGALQTILFEADDFLLSSISSATAQTVAELINLHTHSIEAVAGGLNNKQLILRRSLEGAAHSIQVVGGTANTKFNFSTDIVLGTDEKRASNRHKLKGASYSPGFPATPSDLVEMTFRVVDIQGNPVKDMEVNLVNKLLPSVRASDGSAILGRQALQFFTNGDGILQDKKKGKPKLLKGSVFDIVLRGTDVVRQNLTVPTTNFDVMDLIVAADDIYTIYKPNLPLAPRSS